MAFVLSALNLSLGRSSHEERGLKSADPVFKFLQFFRRSSHEERGLKFLVCYHTFITPRRSSHEERGLKYG